MQKVVAVAIRDSNGNYVTWDLLAVADTVAFDVEVRDTKGILAESSLHLIEVDGEPRLAIGPSLSGNGETIVSRRRIGLS